MPTLIIAGDATTGLVQSAAVDGALTIQSGPAGAKVDAIALSSTGGATFSQITGGALTRATAQAATSGAAITFTGVPSWVKRVTVMFQAVSTNGTSITLVRLGASGSVQTTGYAASAVIPGVGSSNQTVGFPVTAGQDAAMLMNGTLVLTNITGNVWISSGVTSRTDNNTATLTAGNVTLASNLDRVQITMVNGTDVFDAGNVNILYEG